MYNILFAFAVIGAIGLVGGVLLAVISELCKTDGENERLAAIRDALPGANCGSCGFAGCDSYAEAVEKGEAEPNLCAPGGAASAAALSEILGVTIDTTPKVATVRCVGCEDKAVQKYNYTGLNTCAAVAAVAGGSKLCPNGCLGYGDCVDVCDFSAIHIEKGLANVNRDACVGCGKCVKTCPHGVLSLLPAAKPVAVVVCNNTQKGAVAKKGCTGACIGCGLCARKCPEQAITVENFLAKVDPAKCTACGTCVEACVQKAIIIK